jgi:hypothetical protein
LPKIAALALVVAAFACTAALWPSGALAACATYDYACFWADAGYVHVAEEGQMAPSMPSHNDKVVYGSQGHTTSKYVGTPLPVHRRLLRERSQPRAQKYCDVRGYWHKLADEGQDFPATNVPVAYGQTINGVSTNFLDRSHCLAAP